MGSQATGETLSLSHTEYGLTHTQQRIRKYRALVKQQRRHQRLLERGAYKRPSLSFNWDVEVA
mgnify:FL=1